MADHSLVLSLVAVLALSGCGVDAQAQKPITDAPPVYSCEPIEEITVCSTIGYPNASFPNFRDQVDQAEVDSELQSFIPLIENQCSNALVHFLCSVYAPFCELEYVNIRVPPCRQLCEYVRSTCEDELIRYNLNWPPHLDCEQYPVFLQDQGIVCFHIPDLSMLRIPNIPGVNLNGTTTNSTPSSSPPTGTVIPSRDSQGCPLNLRVPEGGSIPDNDSYRLADIKGCGVPCKGIYFSSSQRNDVAPALVLLFFIVCVLFTLFTVATFLIDRRRFHYPERPVIFLSFCYLVIALAYIVGSVSKLVGGSFACTDPEDDDSSFVFQHLPTDSSSYRSASCIILFVMVYYFQMAAAIWWVVLTLTWFLAAALKWGKEPVERLWMLYHIIAWSVPAIQMILVLALQLVDGDQLTGLCYPGNFSNVALGVFVFLPLAVFLLLGLLFLVIGFYALVNIRRQLQKDPEESRKLSRLIARVGVYSVLYTTPNVILLLLIIYELSEKNDWEEAYVSEKNCREGGECSFEPTFTAFILKYLMLAIIGVCSTSWVFSRKTLTAWQKFFCSCGCQTKRYEIPMPIKSNLQTAV